MSDSEQKQSHPQKEENEKEKEEEQETEMSLEQNIARAAKAVANAKFLIFTAGAGLGIDSGLPAFRTKNGLWRAYPAFEKLGIENLSDMSNPEWFERDPSLAWAFWSHRTSLYRRTQPHDGFKIMAKWAEASKKNFPLVEQKKEKDEVDDDEMKDIRSQNYFVFTSNVDGQFQKAGFEDSRVFACHGETKMLQCTKYNCASRNGAFPWPTSFLSQDPIVPFDETTFQTDDVHKNAPRCPIAACGALARPNVMMFGDGDYTESFQCKKEHRLGKFLSITRPSEVAVVEIGAGTAIPTVRRFGEALAKRGCAMIRINPDESEFPARLVGDKDLNLISIPMSSKAALVKIDEQVEKMTD